MKFKLSRFRIGKISQSQSFHGKSSASLLTCEDYTVLFFFSPSLRFLDYGDEPWKNTARDALKDLET